MNICKLSRNDAKTLFAKFKEDQQSFSFGEEYKDMREAIKEKYDRLKSEGYSKYQLDYRFSVWFYNYFSWLSPRLASDYDFWRYIAMCVMPDLIYDRFGIEDSKHYYDKGLRIWPYSLYWYAHLSWQGDCEKTLKLLSSEKKFSTDTFIALVERPCNSGSNIELYRCIMANIGSISPDYNISYKPFLQSVMKLCLAKIMVVEPELCEGGNNAFALSLIQECLDRLKEADSKNETKSSSKDELFDIKPDDLKGRIKLKLNDDGPYSKKDFAFQVISKYVNQHPELTFNELTSIFKHEYLGSWTRFNLLETDVDLARKWKENDEPHCHYFIKSNEELVSSDSVHFVVCLEWDKNNIINIIKLVKQFGWSYEVVR